MQSFRAHERGANAAEYVGMIILAALVISGIWASGIADNVVEKVTCAISSILTGEQSCSAGSATNEFAPDPSAVVVESSQNESSSSGDVNIDVGYAKGGAGVTDGAKYRITVKADGTKTIELGESFSGNIHGSVGDKIDSEVAELAAELKVKGEVNSYKVESWDCDDGSGIDCKEFLRSYAEQIDNRQRTGVQVFTSGSNFDTNIPIPPSERITGLEGTLSLNAALRFEVGVDEGSYTSKAGAGLEGEIKGGVRREVAHDVDDNGNTGDVKSTTDSYFYAMSGKADAAVELSVKETEAANINLSAETTASGEISEEYSVERDADGKLTNITFKTTTGYETSASVNVDGGFNVPKTGESDESERVLGSKIGADGKTGREIETVVSIDVAKLSPNERKEIERYVSSLNSKSPVFPSAVINPSEKPAANDALGKIIHENGVVTTSEYATINSSAESKIDLWIASYSTKESAQQRKLLNQSYLEAPGADGTRKYVKNKDVP